MLMYINQTIEKIDSGYRLPPPPGCSRAMYRMMMKCWYVISYCNMYCYCSYINTYVMFTVLCSTGNLIQDQGHSLDRSQSCYQAVVNICWAGLMKTNRLVVKMLLSWELHWKMPVIFIQICNSHTSPKNYICIANKLESLHISVAVTISCFDLSVMYSNISQSQVFVYSNMCL